MQEADARVLYQDGMPAPPPIEAKSAIVMDPKTGKVLYDKGSELRRQAASTQKLLTALIVAEGGNLGEPIRVEAVDTVWTMLPTAFSNSSASCCIAALRCSACCCIVLASCVLPAMP